MLDQSIVQETHTKPMVINVINNLILHLILMPMFIGFIFLSEKMNSVGSSLSC